MVNEGYRQTDLGLIPNDWNVVGLLDICSLLNGLTYTPDNVCSNGLLVLRSSNIQNGQLAFDDNVYVNCTVEESKLLHQGDILICVRNGSQALIGKCAIAKKNYEYTFGAFMAVLRGSTNGYLIHYLQEGSVQREIIRSSGATINQITNSDFRKVKIAIPQNSNETENIATALSDVDELITNLEKLIAKKKNIKHGVMQELLTGKRRLSGFTGEWTEMVIGKNGYLQKGSINPMLQPEDYFSEYSMPAFDETRSPAKVQGKTMHSNRTVISGRVLLFNKLNVRQKRIWLVDKCEENAVCSGEFLPYCSDSIDLRLLAQILYTDEVTADFIGMSTGTSNSQKRITPKAFLDYSLYLPTDMEEQKALADIFDDMDQEISTLQRQVDKYRQLKQGMMQKLLTGEIRLI